MTDWGISVITTTIQAIIAVGAVSTAIATCKIADTYGRKIEKIMVLPTILDRVEFMVNHCEKSGSKEHQELIPLPANQANLLKDTMAEAEKYCEKKDYLLQYEGAEDEKLMSYKTGDGQLYIQIKISKKQE